MKAYTIKTGRYYENHCVVADNMGEAERIFKGKYPYATIESIELYSEYVQVQGYDEQARKEGI